MYRCLPMVGCYNQEYLVGPHKFPPVSLIPLVSDSSHADYVDGLCDEILGDYGLRFRQWYSPRGGVGIFLARLELVVIVLRAKTSGSLFTPQQLPIIVGSVRPGCVSAGNIADNSIVAI